MRDAYVFDEGIFFELLGVMHNLRVDERLLDNIDESNHSLIMVSNNINIKHILYESIIRLIFTY